MWYTRHATSCRAHLQQHHGAPDPAPAPAPQPPKPPLPGICRVDLSHVRANPTKSRVFIASLSTPRICSGSLLFSQREINSTRRNIHDRSCRLAREWFQDTGAFLDFSYCCLTITIGESSNPQVIRSSSSSFGLGWIALLSLLPHSLFPIDSICSSLPPLPPYDTFVTAPPAPTDSLSLLPSSPANMDVSISKLAGVVVLRQCTGAMV